MHSHPLSIAVLAATLTLSASASARADLTSYPAVIERPAVAGPAGSVTVANHERVAIRIAVRVRPWVQTRSGAASPDRRATVRGMRVGAQAFTLRPGEARVVDLTLRSRPSSGALYAAVEVTGRPEQPVRGQLRVAYRLLTALRMSPTSSAKAKVRLAAERARVTKGSKRAIAIGVRNRGNVVAPLSGSYRLVGPRGTLRGQVAAVRILPGRTVDLRLRAVDGLSRGRYAATLTLRRGGGATTTIRRAIVVR